MTRFRKTVGALSLAAFVMSLLVLAPTPAQARHVNCGIITEDTTLTEDVGPCPGYGLIVRADNITLDLNGHRVFGENGFPEQVGILLDDVSGVTVQNGTVEGFDAGVSIEGGGNNTVRRMIAQNNVNDQMEPFDPRGIPAGASLQDITCDYGDGILTFNSANNLIERNLVRDNGPYSGISLVEDASDGNIVRNNHSIDNNSTTFGPTDVEGNPIFVLPGSAGGQGQHVPAGTPGAVQPTSLCGATQPGAPGMQRGRLVQNIGVRIEGPGASNNEVAQNLVRNSALVGISVHSYVCNPQEGDPRGVTEPNLHNRISRNNIAGTGNETVELDPYADGISLMAQGPIGSVTCGSDENFVMNNSSNDNRRHGISVMSHNLRNTVHRNQVNDNDGDGIFVGAGGFPSTDNTLTQNRGMGNGHHDGHDANPNCDNNLWRDNIFATVNQQCVDPDATVTVPPAPASLSAAAEAEDDLSGVNRGPRA